MKQQNDMISEEAFHEEESTSTINEEIASLERYVQELEDYIKTIEDLHRQGQISQEDYLEKRDDAAQKMGEAMGRLESLK